MCIHLKGFSTDWSPMEAKVCMAKLEQKDSTSSVSRINLSVVSVFRCLRVKVTELPQMIFSSFS